MKFSSVRIEAFAKLFPCIWITVLTRQLGCDCGGDHFGCRGCKTRASKRISGSERVVLFGLRNA